VVHVDRPNICEIHAMSEVQVLVAIVAEQPYLDHDEVVGFIANAIGIDPQGLSLSYIDSEQERIAIGSTVELQEALRETNPLMVSASGRRLRYTNPLRFLVAKLLNGAEHVGAAIEDGAEAIIRTITDVFLLNDEGITSIGK
jgi:hypothetical protein